MPSTLRFSIVCLAQSTTSSSPRLALAVAVGTEGHPQLPDTARHPPFISTRNTNKRQHMGNKVGRPRIANQNLLMRGGTAREDKTEHEPAKKDHRGARTHAATRWSRGHADPHCDFALLYYAVKLRRASYPFAGASRAPAAALSLVARPC